MLDPVERDEDMGRTYYPLPGGWEVQTKGRGSSFRICDTKTGERYLVIDHSPGLAVHHAIEQIAVEARAEIQRLRSALERIAESQDRGRHDGQPEEGPALDEYQAWAIARDALGRQKDDQS